MIASAKSFYDTQTTELIGLSANTVLLDRTLDHYGPEAKEARAVLRGSVARILAVAWPTRYSDKSTLDPTATHAEVLFDQIHGLAPASNYQRSLQTQALSLAVEMGRTRWLMFEQEASSVPRPLLVMLVFWLMILFVSFGLFTRPNAMIVTSLFLSGVAVAGAVLMILEMYSPYSGLIQISKVPCRRPSRILGQ